MPVSASDKISYGISNTCLSFPTIVGLEGVKNHVLPDITDREKRQLRHSASTLREQIEKLNLGF